MQKTILEARKADRDYVRDLWRYRELFYVLAWRDVSVRYKQTAAGIAWALVRPVLSTIIFTIVFGRLGKFPSGGIPYPVLVLTGMLPWQLFSTAMTDSGNSLLSNATLITKVYFPRLIIPGSTLVTSLIDFSISMVILGLLLAVYRIVPGWQIVCLPVFIFLALLTAAAVGTWISALNVKYRDFAFIVPFIAQLGLYISPVAFGSAVIPEKWRMLYSLNPMVSVIDGFRWSLLQGKVQLYWPGVLLSFVIVSIVATTGFVHFRATERRFADVI